MKLSQSYFSFFQRQLRRNCGRNLQWTRLQYPSGEVPFRQEYNNRHWGRSWWRRSPRLGTYHRYSDLQTTEV